MFQDESGLDAFSSTSTQNREPCGICGRSFNPDALSRHIPICQKNSQKKRKAFNSSKQRAEGTDIATVPSSTIKATKRKQLVPKEQENRQAPPPKNNWRLKHEEFIRTVKAARGVDKAIKEGKPLPPPPPPTINPDFIQCQYCERRFNETAAERHIPFCKEQHARLRNKPQQKKPAKPQYKAPLPRGKKDVTPPSTLPISRTTRGGAAGARSPVTPTQQTGRGGRAGMKSPMSGHGRASNMNQSNAKTSNRNYGFSDYTDGSGSTGSSHSSGRALRTGRTAETYSDARDLSAKQRQGLRIKPSPNYNSEDEQFRESPSPSSNISSLSSGSRFSTSAHGRQASGTAKFCHECGTRFPTHTAKFCIECGVRRVTVM